jgi:hypothetical protein
MTIEAGKSATFRYRVVIHPGDFESARIASLFKQYVSGMSITEDWNAFGQSRNAEKQLNRHGG